MDRFKNLLINWNTICIKPVVNTMTHYLNQMIML